MLPPPSTFPRQSTAPVPHGGPTLHDGHLNPKGHNMYSKFDTYSRFWILQASEIKHAQVGLYEDKTVGLRHGQICQIMKLLMVISNHRVYSFHSVYP